MRPGCDHDAPERLGIAGKLTEWRFTPEPSIWLHKGKGRHLLALSSMRPTRIELATFGLKDRRSLDPVKGPLTTELRAPCRLTLPA
jgi:hypothetical protein